MTLSPKKLGLCLAFAASTTGGTADANWSKLDPSKCQRDGPPDSVKTCPNWYECPVVPYTYGRFPELSIVGDEQIHFYCPVPDQTDVPVGSINAVYVAGYSKPSSASAARGCIQFTSGAGEACSAFYPFPDGGFTAFQVPVTALWQQWWHNAYLDLRLVGSGGEGVGTSVYKILYATP